MQDLEGRVAVVTGAAGGIGRALAEEFLEVGAKVVVADIQRDLLEQTVAQLVSRGDVIGVPTDVTDPKSVEALATETYAAFGACNVLCNNAGVGAPSAFVWETTINDWKWVHSVNVMGVIHGVLAFVPRMLESGDDGHVVNTSSGDGGISPLPSASVYAASKAAVTVVTECLASQLQDEGAKVRASIFYPSGGLLKTGLWESEKTRPPELAREVPRKTEPITIEKLEAQAKARGYELPWQDLNELARVVIDGIRAEKFIFMLGVDSIGPTLRRRADHFEKGELVPHDRQMFG
jgi:NAD(P)-dependent dehydrogenase (short-subunit alcohol dehydrogenase family)